MGGQPYRVPARIMRSSPKTFLIVGRQFTQEFAEPLDWLRDRATCVSLPDCQAVLSYAQQPDCPPVTAIVLVTPRLDALSRDDVVAVQCAFPLAVPIVLCGSWCAGQRRRDPLPPPLARWYWHQFVSRCQREFFLDNNTSSFGPVVATEVDRLAFAPRLQPAVIGTARLLVAIRADDRTTFECLSDLVFRWGAPAVWWSARQPLQATRPSIVLWDMARPESGSWNELEQWSQSHPEIPILLLCGFPRVEYYQKANCLSNVALLGKPFSAGDLHVAVQQLLSRCDASARSPRANRQPA